MAVVAQMLLGHIVMSGLAKIVFLSWLQVQWAGTILHFILVASAMSWDNQVLFSPGYKYIELGRLGTP